MKKFTFVHSLLYKRENFPSSGSIAKYTCESESNIAHYDMCSLSTLDISKNNILLQIYGSGNDCDVFYVQLDVNYDFQKEDIIEFDLYAASVHQNELKTVLVNKFVNDTLYDLRSYGSPAESEIKNSIMDDFEAFMNNKADAVDAGDCSLEYNQADKYIFGNHQYN